MRTSLGIAARGLMMSALLATFAFASSANPNSPELGDRYASGAFLEAAELAEAAATADDFAFAARALLALIFTQGEEPDAELLVRARRDAEAALALAPEHAEGRLQLAIALAVQSRGMGAMDVWNSGIGEKGRRLASDVLKADPANYYAHGYLAVWNVEVRRRAGAIGAGFMGASVSDGREHFEAAVALAPDDVGIYWQYARALAALDARRYDDDIEAALAKATSSPPRDRVEQVMQARARELLAAMTSDRKAAQKLARDLM